MLESRLCQILDELNDNACVIELAWAGPTGRWGRKELNPSFTVCDLVDLWVPYAWYHSQPRSDPEFPRHHHHTCLAPFCHIEIMEDLSPGAEKMYKILKAEMTEEYENKFPNHKKESLDSVRIFVRHKETIQGCHLQPQFGSSKGQSRSGSNPLFIGQRAQIRQGIARLRDRQISPRPWTAPSI